MRDRDVSSAWTAASDGTLEERVYYVQNWRSDVVAIVDAGGRPLETVRYSAYGSPSVHPLADINGDGVVNTTDQSVWSDHFAGYSTAAIYETNNINRDVYYPGDTADDDEFQQSYLLNSGKTFGFNKLSSLGNRKGYAGYEWDPSATTWHVRHRVLDSASGKWTRMDPLMYVDGASLVEYVKGHSVLLVDPYGLACSTTDVDMTQSMSLKTPPVQVGLFYGGSVSVRSRSRGRYPGVSWVDLTGLLDPRDGHPCSSQ